MFINCPNCSALVATDLATDLPPERCPRCGFGPLVEAVELELPKEKATGTPPDPGPEDGLDAEPETEPPPELAPGHTDETGIEPEAAPGPESEPEPQSKPAPEPRSEAAPAAEPEPRAEPGNDAGPEPQAEPASTATAAPGARPAPRFLHRRDPSATGVDRRLVAVAAGLALLLAVQLLIADRMRLAQEAAWRPVVATLCGVLRCSLPAWREPDAIAVEQRDVRPLPGREGVLRVSATIRNDARWAQAWPRLTLTLSDMDGRALGMRAFEPAEYLTAPPQDITVASGASAPIQLDIVEPSPHAVAFNFRFD